MVAGKPYRSRMLEALILFSNALFLFHFFFLITLVLYFFSGAEAPEFYQSLLRIMLTKTYIVFYFLSDLWFILLLRLKKKRKLIQGSDYLLAVLLMVKYVFLALLCLLVLMLASLMGDLKF